MLRKRWVELSVVRDDGKIEQTQAVRPLALIPFYSRPIGVTPGIGRIVESAGVEERPVEEIHTSVVRVLIVIKNVGDRELTHRDDHAVGGVRPIELVWASLD